MAYHGKLYHPKRYITTHDDSGKSVIDQSISSDAPFYELRPGDAHFAQCYVTKEFPTKIENGADIGAYQEFLSKPPGLTVSTGTVLRYVDVPPGLTSPMHSTVSLDYGVVLEGTVELILDSGEKRLMQRGDICVQRATMHAWRNTSETEWARMLYILQPVEQITEDGKQLKEDYGGMHGVNASS